MPDRKSSEAEPRTAGETLPSVVGVSMPSRYYASALSKNTIQIHIEHVVER